MVHEVPSEYLNRVYVGDVMDLFKSLPDRCQVAQPYQNPTDKRILRNLASGSKGTMLSNPSAILCVTHQSDTSRTRGTPRKTPARSPAEWRG